MNIPQINECYQKDGRRWIVVDNTAGVITLKSANGKRPSITLHLSQLSNFKKIR